MSAAAAYTRFELRRAVRNRRFLVFSLGFPVALLFLIVAPQPGNPVLSGTGVSYATYFMASLASYGTSLAMISCGARIATERKLGWTRQLRVTPLSARDYLWGKLTVAYGVAIVAIVLLYISGLILGASMAAGDWLAMTGLILLGLLPFGALGIAIGHLLTPDAIGPLTGGLITLLGFVSGEWFPVTHGFLRDVGLFLPSYWLVQAGRIAVPGGGWGARGWITMILWTIALTAFARWAYRRDTGRL